MESRGSHGKAAKDIEDHVQFLLSTQHLPSTNCTGFPQSDKGLEHDIDGSCVRLSGHLHGKFSLIRIDT